MSYWIIIIKKSWVLSTILSKRKTNNLLRSIGIKHYSHVSLKDLFIKKWNFLFKLKAIVEMCLIINESECKS